MDDPKKSQKKYPSWDDFKKLESRISHLERRLESVRILEKEPEDTASNHTENMRDMADRLEFRIGQYWFAKAGIVVLAIGIAFLLTFPYQNLPGYLPVLVGYLVVGGLFLLSHSWRNTYEFISRYILGGGMVLLYFTTLRLYYFSNTPLVSDRLILIILLGLSVFFSLVVAVKKNSSYMTGLALTLGYSTAVISKNAYPLFFILLLLSLVVIYLWLRFRWKGLYIYGMILTYFTHFMWFINNPVLGQPLQLVHHPKLNIIFIVLYMIIFSSGILLRKKDQPEDNFVILNTFLNCFLGFSLFLIITVLRVAEQLFISHLIASILFLVISVLFWVREKSRFSTFFYSILGYSALSVAIIAQFKIPESLIWLCWQSLLVISTAIWFRSKIIVVANFIIFLVIFIAFLIAKTAVGPVSLSFGFVALLSARIMNWKKHRLELQTELMRNAYLGTAFIMIPYALYYSVPKSYVGLAWVGAALFYYALSLILQNKKYRWMALLTLSLTVLYLLIIGMIKLDPIYRIISFMVLGMVLLIVSFLYTRTKMKSGQAEPEKDE